MSYKVFIGYSSEDNDIAEYICQCLARVVELQPYKAELNPAYGEDFKERIQNELSSSHFMVVLLTENGKNSQWVNQEIGYAQSLRFQRKKEVTPLIIPVSYKQVKLKGFITKDTADLLFIDNFPSRDYVIADILFTIRRHVQKGLDEGVFHIKVACSNCVDKRGLPHEWEETLPDHKSMEKASNLGKSILPYRCPRCGRESRINIRTMLPYSTPFTGKSEIEESDTKTPPTKEAKQKPSVSQDHTKITKLNISNGLLDKIYEQMRHKAMEIYNDARFSHFSVQFRPFDEISYVSVAMEFYSKWAKKICYFSYNVSRGELAHVLPDKRPSFEFQTREFAILPWKESPQWMKFIERAYAKIGPLTPIRNTMFILTVISGDSKPWQLTFEDGFTGDEHLFHWDGKEFDEGNITQSS